MANAPAISGIVRLPKDPRRDLSAIEDRQRQLALIGRHQQRTITLGYLTLLLFFGGVLGWAALMPLSGAVVAQGEVQVEGSNKPVQHFGGGIISEILVREGDLVRQGDVLLRLDDTNSDAGFEMVQGRHVATLVQEARLLAERDGREGIAWPAEVLQRAQEPEVAALMDAQEKVFEARRDNWATQAQILTERVTQLNEEIQGLRAQRTSVVQQLALIDEEARSVSYLVKEGFSTKPRLLALQRQQAALTGQQGQVEAAMARTEQRINETRLQSVNLKERVYESIVQELKDVQNALKDLRERRRAAEAANLRMEVRAPITGYVQGMAVVGINQVVGTGHVLMSIVPKDQPLVISIKVKPSDIDEVQIGQKANVTLSIYNFRTFSKSIDGIVTAIDADKSKPQDIREMQAFGTGYYKATVRLDQEQIEQYRKSDNIDLYVGSPVMVVIPTIARTALEYLLAPLLQGLDTAFREQ